MRLHQLAASVAAVMLATGTIPSCTQPPALEASPPVVSSPAASPNTT
ncbi:MAG: hypothetical protein NZ772_05995 [Cyanobacteria bacterium]|nr:hypothetical protein [Cyanobacteriota bacterium]MDW8201068.1 hypothetical protein [Cyanobacteriota bacterium SKYGB_h_bin112]